MTYRGRYPSMVVADHPLAEPIRHLRADLAADPGRGAVEIEVRGAGTNGWSDWHRIPADGVVFDQAVSSAQVRIRLTLPVVPLDGASEDAGAPRVTAVALTAAPGV